MSDITLSDEELTALRAVAVKGRPMAFVDANIGRRVVGHLEQVGCVTTEIGFRNRLYAAVTPLGAKMLAAAPAKIRSM